MSKNLPFKLIIIALSVGMAMAVAMARQKVSASNAAAGGGTATAATSLPAALNGFTVEPASATYDATKLLRGVKALKPGNMYLSTRRAKRIVRAVVRASKRTGVDPYLLVAVIRMESDFRHNLQMIHPNCYKPKRVTCQADCGLSQHYIKGKKAWVLAYCKRLATNYDLAVRKSAEELARHIKFCGGRSRFTAWSLRTLKNSGAPMPMRACVLQRYNSGPRFRHAKMCQKRYRCRKYMDANENVKGEKPHWVPNPSYGKCAYKRRKCFGRAHYYAQAECFFYGARTGLREKRSCRRCRDTRKISTRFYPAPTAPTPSAAAR